MKSTVCKLSCLFVLAGCSPHRVTHKPKPPALVGAEFSQASQAPLPEKWWRDFGDPELNRLVEETIARNFQLEAAWARLEQAEAVARGAAGGYWPQVDLSFSASRRRFRSPFADAQDGQAGIPEFFEFTQYNGSLAASYEVDVWKRIGNRAKAAGLDAAAARDAAEGLAMTLVAQVAEAWFDLAFQSQRKALLLEQIEVNDTFLELTNLRFQQGLASALDIYQQKQLVLQRQSELAQVEGALIVARNRLAVLIGRSPGTVEIAGRDALPAMPALPGVGIPANLLDRRPDVRAARRRVEAADHRVAAAVADRLPSLRLQASLDVQNGDITELFSGFPWTLLAGIAAPIFQGGRLAAEVDRNEALVREQLASYGDVFISAVGEVENALVQERQQLAQIAELERQVTVADEALREARIRYREGLSDFLPVLTALQGQQNAQIAVLSAKRQALSFRVQLVRALGGSWTAELSSEPKKSDSGAGTAKQEG